MRSLFESGGVRESVKISGQLMFAEISGPSPLCKDAIGTYTINNFPPGATVQWSTSGALQIVQTNDSSVVVKSMDESAGNSFLYAQITMGSTHVNLTKVIGTKTSYRVAGNSYVNCGSMGSWGASFSGCIPTGNVSYEGTITNTTTGEQVTFYTSGISLFSSCKKTSLLSSTANSNDNVIMQPPGLPQAYYDISITTTTEFGGTYFDEMNNISVYGYVTILTLELDKLDYNLLLTPNPASHVVTISLTNEQSKNSSSSMQLVSETGSYQIQLWSPLGLVKTVQTDQPEYQLDLTGVPPGFYYVHVIKNGQTYRQQLVVK